MKKFLHALLFGMAIGCSIFTLVGIAFDIRNSGRHLMEHWSYTKMALGALFVGIGFSAPTPVYDSTRLPLGLKVLIHMGVGCTVMLIIAFAVGWIPTGAGVKVCLLVIGCELLSAFVIWLCCYRHYKKLAEQMNEKIKSRKLLP